MRYHPGRSGIENRMMNFFLLVCFLFFVPVACTNEDKANEPGDLEPGSIFQNYQIWGEEGREEVTIRLQFHEGGEDGQAIQLRNTGTVFFDGTPLPADSTKFNGVYYETAVPVEAFQGEHTIRFLGNDGREYSEKFSFQPFALAEELPESLKKLPFDIRIENLPDEPTPVRLVMVDTSMKSTDVNEEVVVEDGKLTITEDYLSNLTEGPVYLEIYREEERPVENKARGGGKIMITYALKRQFTLTR